MPRKANTKSGRTTIDLSPDCKALLLRLCEQEQTSMNKLIHHALINYEEWLVDVKARLGVVLDDMRAERREERQRKKKAG